MLRNAGRNDQINTTSHSRTLQFPSMKPCKIEIIKILDGYMIQSGPGSSVGIVTGYGLDGPGMESQWGARFSAPVQTGPGAHPVSCTMGTESFPGGK